MNEELRARIERRRRELITILQHLPAQEAEGDMDEMVRELRSWRRLRQRANAATT